VAGAEVTAVARTEHEKELWRSGGHRWSPIRRAASGLYHLVADWVGGPSPRPGSATSRPAEWSSSAPVTPDKTPVNIYDFFDHEGARLVAYLSYAYPETRAPT
jgi:hypothetical protein